jgi:organic radical activating enzyme
MACEIPGEEVTVDQMLQKDESRATATYAVLQPNQLAHIIWDLQPGPFELVIQGGEPASHDLLELTHILSANDYNVSLHTGGELPFAVCEDTHISIRPRTRLVLPAALNAADEVIFIVRDPSDLAWLDILIEHIDYEETEIFIHPGAPGALQFCADAASNRGFRLSYTPDAIK